MAASKLQANWSAVAFASTSITRVTNVSFDKGGQLSEFRGDGDRIATTIACLSASPSASVTTGDVAVAMNIEPGAVGTLTATHKDAAKATGGDVIYVLANAVCENVQTSGAQGAFGTATLSVRAYSIDGVTNPLSFTRA